MVYALVSVADCLRLYYDAMYLGGLLSCIVDLPSEMRMLLSGGGAPHPRYDRYGA